MLKTFHVSPTKVIEMKENKEINNKKNKDGNAEPQADSTPKEIGGPKGLEPTRYGDWEKKGRCIDF